MGIEAARHIAHSMHKVREWMQTFQSLHIFSKRSGAAFTPVSVIASLKTYRNHTVCSVAVLEFA